MAESRQLDAQIDVVTPENVAFRYEAAGPMRRMPAYMIDMMIRVVAIMAILFAAQIVAGAIGLPGVSFSTFLLSWFALSYFYGGFFETYWNGQTPGKRMLGLRTVRIDGQPINAMQAVMRNILRDVDGMPPLFLGSIPMPTYWLGLTVMTSTSRYQRLGDLVCGTMVIVEARRWLDNATLVNDPRAIELAEALPANYEVRRELGMALAQYVSRRERFSAGRRADIARFVGAPLVERFNLPQDTSHDLLLCALYYKTFVADFPGMSAAARRPQPDRFEIVTR